MRFVLTHGGMHGGWCWKYVLEELAALGVSAIAPDLPGHGERANEPATLDGYRDALLDVHEPDDVLVGHSLGGSFICLAADAAPEKVRRLIYIAALLPEEDRSLAEVMPFVGDAKEFELTPDSYRLADADAARAVFYNDCTPEQVIWAYGQVRPQSLQPWSRRYDSPGFGIPIFPAITFPVSTIAPACSPLWNINSPDSGRRRSIRSGPRILL
jgi:pimeloyl-ACP methyl ester carboxylesterase